MGELNDESYNYCSICAKRSKFNLAESSVSLFPAYCSVCEWGFGDYTGFCEGCEENTAFDQIAKSETFKVEMFRCRNCGYHSSKLYHKKTANDWVSLKEGLDRHLSNKNVNHPSHYQSDKIECIDVIEAFKLDFNLGNTIKYVLRAGKKGDLVEDLEKAKWYLSREIENCKKKF